MLDRVSYEHLGYPRIIIYQLRGNQVYKEVGFHSLTPFALSFETGDAHSSQSRFKQ